MTEIFTSEAAASEIRARYLDLLTHWPVASTQQHVPTGQGDTFVVACGAEDAPPLVLLHGSGSTAANWMSDAAAWSRRFRVYAVDLIGEPGLSARSRPPLGGDAYAEWLDDVLLALGVEKAAFVGVSLGGWLALDYAVRRPRRVDRMALLCPAGVGRQRYFILKVAVFTMLGPWGLRKAREMAFGPQPRDLPPVGQLWVTLTALIQRNFRPRMVRFPIFSDADLRALAMPALVIVGGRDLTLDSHDTQRRLARTNSGVIVQVLPEARHHIPGQTGVILEFLLRPMEARSQA